MRPHFEHRHPELVHQPHGFAFERPHARVVGGDRTALDAKRIRNQGGSEQRRFNMGERQHPGQITGALGEQIMSAVAKGALDDPFPRRQVKERPRRTGMDKLVPPSGILGPERPYGDGER